jgi:hypothetical protein
MAYCLIKTSKLHCSSQYFCFVIGAPWIQLLGVFSVEAHADLFSMCMMSAEKLNGLLISTTEGCEFNCEYYLQAVLSIKWMYVQDYCKYTADAQNSVQQSDW